MKLRGCSELWVIRKWAGQPGSSAHYAPEAESLEGWGDNLSKGHVAQCRVAFLRWPDRKNTDSVNEKRFQAVSLIDAKPLISASRRFGSAVDAFELAGDRSKSMKVHLTF